MPASEVFRKAIINSEREVVVNVSNFEFYAG
jgi:hypothetical protein